MDRKGENTSIIVLIVVVILFGVISALLVFNVKDNYIDGLLKFITRQSDVGSYEENCTLLVTTADNFEANAEDVFSLTLQYDVKDITYFSLFFDSGWGAINSNAWYLEWWKVTCTGTSGEKELMRYTNGHWIEDKTMFGKTENQGYDTDLGCGKAVKVTTKTGDQWWSGTDGDVYLCYMRERPPSGS